MLKTISDPALDEIFVSSKPVFDGRLLHVHVDTVRLPNGKITTREMADHQGAIAVVPILPDGSGRQHHLCEAIPLPHGHRHVRTPRREN